MSKTETVSIECDNTALGTGPVEHDLDPDDTPDGSELIEAPLHWLTIMAVRVVPNPNAKNTTPPPVPETFDEASVNMWLQQVAEANQAEGEPAHITQSVLAHLTPAEAHKLALAIPDVWDGNEDFVDLALAAKGGAE